MKKKIISLAAVAIVAVAAAVGVSKNANEVELSDLALANVEALANDESTLPSECEGVQERTCCVIGNTHHTWCRAVCDCGCLNAETRNCSHSY